MGDKKTTISDAPRPQCKNCGVVIVNHPFPWGRASYCGHTCQQIFLQRAYIERWLAGKENGILSDSAVSGRIRRYLISLRGNKCEKCGWHEVNQTTGLVPLQMEHVDGDWKNNRPENLQLLCPNCHSLTPTFGSLNRGRGRPRHRHGKESVADRISAARIGNENDER